MINKVLLIVLCFWAGLGSAQEEAPHKVTIGMYLMGISKLDFVQKTFKLSSYVWWLHQKPSFKPEQSVEITNAEQYSYDKTTTDQVDGRIRVQAHIHGTIDHDWQLSNYPFDRQTIHIRFEDSLFDESGLQFDVDKENSGVHPSFKLEGWQISNFQMSLNSNQYQTNFGDPKTKKASFSQVDVSLDLKREGWPIFMNSFVGFFVGFLLIVGGYFIPIENLIGRNNLLIGSIFATIGNKYYLENSVSNPMSFSLTDAVESATCLIILLFLVINLMGHQLHRDGNTLKAERVNKIGFFLNILVFSLMVGIRLLVAIFS